MASISNFKNEKGTLEDVIQSSDVFIGVSKGNSFPGSYIKKMNDRPIIFGLANPTPEIYPEQAI